MLLDAPASSRLNTIAWNPPNPRVCGGIGGLEFRPLEWTSCMPVGWRKRTLEFKVLVPPNERPYFLLCFALAATLAATPPEPSKEPKITSVFPFSLEMGKPADVTIRGKNLKNARSIWFAGTGAGAVVGKVEAEGSDDVLHARFTLIAAAKQRHTFRVITPDGMSNALPVLIAARPDAISGRIAKPGDVQSYNIKASAGETLSFDVRSGFATMDPVVTIARKSGSWFDPDRIDPIATNDDPLYFPGLSTDAHLVHKFAEAGDYVVRVSSFSGQGGPDHAFELAIARGATPDPVLHPKLADDWEERQFTRSIAADWLGRITARGGTGAESKAVETFRAATESHSGPMPVFTPPGVIEGRIGKAAEAHVIQLKIDKAQDLAIEIETPDATMPRFNPVVRLTDPSGHEMVTNVYTKLNNNGLYMMKMIQAKATFTLTAAGVYTLHIRDITTDRGGEDFRYRVLVRPQIPHVGKLVASVGHVNLKAGATQTINVNLDREEDFGGTVALVVENLPQGVTAIPAMEKPVERPPLPNGGRLERYVPKPQMASIILSAAPDAALADTPTMIRLTARPIVKGELRDPIPVAEIPMMVVAAK